MGLNEEWNCHEKKTMNKKIKKTNSTKNNPIHNSLVQPWKENRLVAFKQYCFMIPA
jgi:hypothetical protein